MLCEAIDYHCYVQFLFYRQWNALRAYLQEKGLRVIGDLPIYVPYDSADVWEHPGLFQLDADRRPLGVAGVPPDYFCVDGQLWGNPLYDWDAMAADGYRWWIDRLRAAGGLFDVCGSTISVGWRATGPCRRTRPRRATASGNRAPAWR